MHWHAACYSTRGPTFWSVTVRPQAIVPDRAATQAQASETKLNYATPRDLPGFTHQMNARNFQ